MIFWKNPATFEKNPEKPERFEKNPGFSRKKP